MSGSTAHDQHTGTTEHVVPLKTYVGVFFALIIGTILTTAVAYVDLGRWNTVVALAIAVAKMLFVILFFMHVKYNPGLTRIIIVGAFFWLGIMICFSMTDELTRSWEYNPLPWNPSVIVPYISSLLW
jgi:cytochrome c oxidase subunit IV